MLFVVSCVLFVVCVVCVVCQNIMHGTPEHTHTCENNNKRKTKCQNKQVAFNLANILEIIENGIPEHTHVKKQQKCKTKVQQCKLPST